MKAFLEGLWPSIPENRLDCLRTLFGFVTDEIATVPSGSDDALLTLSAREGSAVGKSRLLVTVLRAVGLPARTVLGLQLAEGQPPFTTQWVETWIDGDWVPMSPIDGFFATRPANLVALRTGSLAEIETTGRGGGRPSLPRAARAPAPRGAGVDDDAVEPAARARSRSTGCRSPRRRRCACCC